MTESEAYALGFLKVILICMAQISIQGEKFSSARYTESFKSYLKILLKKATILVHILILNILKTMNIYPLKSYLQSVHNNLIKIKILKF